MVEDRKENKEITKSDPISGLELFGLISANGSEAGMSFQPPVVQHMLANIPMRRCSYILVALKEGANEQILLVFQLVGSKVFPLNADDRGK